MMMLLDVDGVDDDDDDDDDHDDDHDDHDHDDHDDDNIVVCSKSAVAYSEEFIVSVILGMDVVPRCVKRLFLCPDI